MGMGSNTHQTMQITVTPSVMAASAENPLADMRYAAATARMGPAGKASCLNDLIEKVPARDINGLKPGSVAARLPMAPTESN